MSVFPYPASWSIALTLVNLAANPCLSLICFNPSICTAKILLSLPRAPASFFFLSCVPPERVDIRNFAFTHIHFLSVVRQVSSTAPFDTRLRWQSQSVSRSLQLTKLAGWLAHSIELVLASFPLDSLLLTLCCARIIEYLSYPTC